MTKYVKVAVLSLMILTLCPVVPAQERVNADINWRIRKEAT